MERPKFNSVFMYEMYAYLDFKRSSGYEESNFYSNLRTFDRFCTDNSVEKVSFSTELADEWIKRRTNEASTTHYSRINSVKQFLIYLSRKNYSVFVTRDICFKQTDFQPHIYSVDEIRRYFLAVDTFDSYQNKKDKIQYPVMFGCSIAAERVLMKRSAYVNRMLILLKALLNCLKPKTTANDISFLEMIWHP